MKLASDVYRADECGLLSYEAYELSNITDPKAVHYRSGRESHNMRSFCVSFLCPDTTSHPRRHAGRFSLQAEVAKICFRSVSLSRPRTFIASPTEPSL